MPKKQKNKFKPSWKIFGLITAGLILVAMITAQVMYNRYMWDVAEEHAAFKMGTLIKSAVDNLDDLKTELGSDGKVEELRIQLPEDNPDVYGVRYFHYDAGEQGDESPEYVQITSRTLVKQKTNTLIVHRNVEELFEAVPGTQACARGFLLQTSEASDDTNSLVLSGTRQLNDGRTLYVYRETACNATYGLDELEDYLLQAKSY